MIIRLYFRFALKRDHQLEVLIQFVLSSLYVHQICHYTLFQVTPSPSSPLLTNHPFSLESPRLCTFSVACCHLCNSICSRRICTCLAHISPTFMNYSANFTHTNDFLTCTHDLPRQGDGYTRPYALLSTFCRKIGSHALFYDFYRASKLTGAFSGRKSSLFMHPLQK